MHPAPVRWTSAVSANPTTTLTAVPPAAITLNQRFASRGEKRSPAVIQNCIMPSGPFHAMARRSAFAAIRPSVRDLRSPWHTAPVIQGVRRGMYLVLGVVCVGLGVIGALLPVLPTTVFLIVALWAFARSSPRLERWLLDHPRFGPRLAAWRANRVIPLPVKLVAWGSMTASMTVMIVGGAPTWATALAGGIIVIGAVYIARCPSRVPRPPVEFDVPAT